MVFMIGLAFSMIGIKAAIRVQNKDVSLSRSGFEEKEEVPLEHMPFVRDALVAAETNLRHPPETGDDADVTVSPSAAASGGDPAASAQAAFASLARFFRETDNPQKAIYFYDKCLAAAVDVHLQPITAHSPTLRRKAC